MERIQAPPQHVRWSWITVVIHQKLLHFHQMNHGSESGVDCLHCGVIVKAIVGKQFWAKWMQVGECPSAGWGRHAELSGVKVMHLPAPMW